MPNDLQLSDQDEVLLESLVLAASDNVARAPASDRDQYAPERRRAFVETSGAENVYLGTGSAWVDVSENTGLLSKLFSGGDGNFDSVKTEKEHIGSHSEISEPQEGLASEIESLLGDGVTAISIHEPEDGSAYQWDKDLTIDLTEHSGVQLEIDDTVNIEYGGSGWALTVIGHNDANGGRSPDDTLRLNGGRWIATADATGWLRLDDVFFSDIWPDNVWFENSSGDCYGIVNRNVNAWCEVNDFRGHIEADRGIDFRPASVTGGADGTPSFQGVSLTNLHINARDFAARLRGDWKYTNVRNLTLWARGDDVDLLRLGAQRMDKSQWSTVKLENPADTANTTGVVLENEYDGFYGPFVQGMRFGFGINTNVRVDSPAGQDNFHTFDQIGNELEYQERVEGKKWSVDLEAEEMQVPASIEAFNDDGNGIMFDVSGYNNRISPSAKGPIIIQSSTDTDIYRFWNNDYGEFMAPQAFSNNGIRDVRQINSPVQGMLAYHDPSINGDTNTEGPAFYDGSGWTSLVDGSTIS